MFMPGDKLDQPCDVVLVVEDGKEFKAHRNVLREASPFFEKLLNSDLKESSKEGVVRLEMFSESVMAATLEFIYTGHVQILAEDNARDLIVMADYLSLERLKTLVEEVLEQKLNVSNCISTYYFSERYQCQVLLSKSKKFIFANFTAVYAANREDVLNMSSKEVEMWISSDEIDVRAEEDVFKIILAWIDHDKNKRKKYFAELFCHVRLVYVSRDFLISDVVTNDLVKENGGCFGLVKDAIHSIDSKNYDYLSVSPRKSLETPIILTLTDDEMFCYYPEEDCLYCFGKMNQRINPVLFHRVVACHGKLYAFKSSFRLKESRQQVLKCYNPYSNRWMVLPFLQENRALQDIFVRNKEDELYALLSERSTNLNVSIISKYNPLSNSWEDVSTFDSFELRRDICIVAKGNFIYFIGGAKEFHESMSDVCDVDRYDFSKNQWDKVADIRVARSNAYGVAARGKIFIAGGKYNGQILHGGIECEVYDETLNEWQFIKYFNNFLHSLKNLLSIDDMLYALDIISCGASLQKEGGCKRRHIIVDCYNFEKNEFEIKYINSISDGRRMLSTDAKACSLRIFKGFFNSRHLVKTYTPKCKCPRWIQTSFSPGHVVRQRHCSIL
ncbi:hypothetical protein ACROYT_G037018 [Oculina patagonica]